jgi:hypothetical protein
VLTTPVDLNSIKKLEHLVHVLCFENASDFSSCLNVNPEKKREIGRNAWEFAKNNFSDEKYLSSFESYL